MRFKKNIDNIDNAQSHGHLIAPHGGELVDLKLDPENAAELKASSRDFPRAMCCADCACRFSASSSVSDA